MGLLLAAFAILLSLGTWQVERLVWKEALLATIAERRAAPPAPLADIEAAAAAGQDIDYRTVTATGTFEHGRERHFLATWNGESGFYVFTPLTLADGRSLFINRGFVPYDRKDPAKRSEGQVAGPVTVTGLARPPLAAKPSLLVPDNDAAKNVFYWKDLAAMTTSAGLDPARTLPLFVDADATPNPGGLPIGGVTQVDLPNNHLQYAVTWYGLALALAGVVLVAWVRRRSAPAA
ncbi:SURF1 family protein [Rhizobium sp. RU20A]|uniref:SURF1 family protein n=1 Tax=Rhizobium sp. RU20A TaxID=1907412 RepID=UPI00122C66D1|nr:SURF1 family protein [Rhizobium sp. RU20A]